MTVELTESGQYGTIERSVVSTNADVWQKRLFWLIVWLIVAFVVLWVLVLVASFTLAGGSAGK